MNQVSQEAIVAYGGEPGHKKAIYNVKTKPGGTHPVITQVQIGGYRGQQDNVKEENVNVVHINILHYHTYITY